MIYSPIPSSKKEEWIKWLKDQQRILSGKAEIPTANSVFETPVGDVATGKDLVGNLLALLTNENVEIN